MHLRTILNSLPKSERLRLTGIFVYMFIGGVVETLSVVSIGPFLAIAANPEWIETNKYIGSLYDFCNFQRQQVFPDRSWVTINFDKCIKQCNYIIHIEQVMSGLTCVLFT